MKSAGIFRGMVMGLAALGVCLSGAAFAVPPAAKPVVHDVALMNGGNLVGQLVDTQGVPKAGMNVTLSLEQRPLAVAKTDAAGRFAFGGLQGGVYQLTAADGSGVYRLWVPGTAPKGTSPIAMITSGDTVVGAQGPPNGYYYQYQPNYRGVGRAKFLLSNPWVVSGIVATAVAVPVGIHNADRGAEPASP